MTPVTRRRNSVVDAGDLAPESIGLHPTPQHRRHAWQPLDGEWGFAFDDDDVGRSQGWPGLASPFDRTIRVPFAPETGLSGIGDRGPHRVLWYQRQFAHSRPPDSGRVLLRFGAVDYVADIWLNGAFVGSHVGGHASFSIDITDFLVESGDQRLVVRCEDSPTDAGQPRGKQFWEDQLQGAFLHRTSGIWQPVWLEAVGGTYVTEIRWTPESTSLLRLQVRLNREPAAGHRLRVRLTRGGTVIAEDSYVADKELERGIALEPAILEFGHRRLLWAPDHPNLIDTYIAVEDARGRTVDAVDGYVGMRTARYSDGMFLLNERPTYLRLVLSQGYWPDSHLSAPNSSSLRDEVKWVKRLGFNGVRIHQKVEDPRFLYWCDRLGVLAWSEMANAYRFSEAIADRFVREWLEVIRRDHNHPSIVTWVPFNESWGIPDIATNVRQRDFVLAVYHLTKAMDASRPALGNDGWEHVAGDVLGVHDYASTGAALRQRYGSTIAMDETITRGRPLHKRIVLPESLSLPEATVLSEFGGISFDPEPGAPWYGYGTVKDESEFIARYSELVSAIVESPTLAGFCYTQLTDTEYETNGLLTAQREPKVRADAIARITRQPAAAMPGDAIRDSQHGRDRSRDGSAS